MLNVMVGEEWPSSSLTTLVGTPDAGMSDAAVCPRVMQPDPWEFGRIHSCLEPVGDCVRVVRHPELVGSGYRPQTTPRAGNPGGSFTGTQNALTTVHRRLSFVHGPKVPWCSGCDFCP